MLGALLSTLVLASLARGSHVYQANGSVEKRQSNSQSSMSRMLYINSINDFCLFAPPTPGQTIGDTEAEEVSWCTSSNHGTRTMPAGTVQAAHFLETPHYTQITGYGDFTKINVMKGDEGGELDPHGATGKGNPVGGEVYANGVKINEWHEFISDTEFCVRVCKPASDAWLWCQHIYDLQGCEWNDPGNYGSGFDTCQGDSTDYPPGIYNNNGALSTFQQGDGSTPAPPAHAAGASSNCQAQNTINAGAAPPPSASPASPSPTTSAQSQGSTSSNGGSASGNGVSASGSAGSGSGSASGASVSYSGAALASNSGSGSQGSSSQAGQAAIATAAAVNSTTTTTTVTTTTTTTTTAIATASQVIITTPVATKAAVTQAARSSAARSMRFDSGMIVGLSLSTVLAAAVFAVGL